MAPLTQATVCSANPHKLAEFRELFGDWDLELLEGAEFPPEDGETYADNARIKARYGRAVGPADRWMLADDSGIEVAALGGAPGVLTARWAEDRHVEKILAALDGVDDRRAQYVCELVALSPDGEEVVGTGVLRGRSPAAPRARKGSVSTRSSSRSAKSAPSQSWATRGRRSIRTGRSPRRRCATS